MKWSARHAVAVALFCALGWGLSQGPAANSQGLMSPNYVPIGVSAAGNVSTAWFHDPASRQAVSCQTVLASGSGLSAIQCVSTRLP